MAGIAAVGIGDEFGRDDPDAGAEQHIGGASAALPFPDDVP
jgi:hypothetical protein